MQLQDIDDIQAEEVKIKFMEQLGLHFNAGETNKLIIQFDDVIKTYDEKEYPNIFMSQKGLNNYEAIIK